MDRRQFIKNGTVLLAAGGLCLYCRKTGIDGEVHIGQNNTEAQTCRFPFEYCEIHDGGKVYPCCPMFLNTDDFGNIFEQSFNDIWNGEKYKKLRTSIQKGDFSLCKRDTCVYEPVKNIEDIYKKPDGPKEMLLTYNPECNYRCITCRDEYIINDKQTNDFLDNEFLPKIMPVLKKLEKISISGGDPLFSNHTRKLISKLATENPEIKISLCTQGYLLDEENLKQLNIKKLDVVKISVNATNRNTYKKIMRIDAFDRIMKNVEFISNLQKEGKVNTVIINFVIHSMNYKEMKAFVEMAEKLDILAVFTTYAPWVSAEMHKRYKEVAVFEPFHKDYDKFCKILQDPIFLGKHCILTPPLLKIAKNENSPVDRNKNLQGT